MDDVRPYDSYDPLAALGARLSAGGLTINYAADGLHVTNEDMPGHCDAVQAAADTITCRRRTEDGGTLWFFSSRQKPIAPAEHVEDAALYVRAYLNRRHEVSS